MTLLFNSGISVCALCTPYRNQRLIIRRHAEEGWTLPQDKNVKTGTDPVFANSPSMVTVASMPRVARHSIGGLIYHVLNRAHSRRRLFATDADYLAFVATLVDALRRFPGVRLLAFCIMPNHWHLVLWPTADGELSRFMSWLTQTHTQRWRQFHDTVGAGALYQGRFKSFVVQDDHHLLVLCRYVERNALRARLVRSARAWRWCSARARGADHPLAPFLLDRWPVPRPANWNALLDTPQRDSDEARVRVSVARSRPLGEEGWVQKTARTLGLLPTFRPPGRPRGAKDSRKRRKRSDARSTRITQSGHAAAPPRSIG
jgi:putative transposase